MYDVSPAAVAVSPELFFQNIRKRNGAVTPFQAEEITEAILKAAQATGEFDQQEARRLTVWVLGLAKGMLEHEIPEVESIQDLVEEVLLSSPHKKTAKANILYPGQRSLARKLAEEADVKIIDQYLARLDWKIEENSNMSYSLQGLNHHISSEISETYWLNAIYPPEVSAKTFVRTVCSRYQLPYFTISPSFSICPTHGYLNGEQEKCELCGEKTEIYSRVVGYMRPIGQWNKGKRAEFGKRRHFHVEAQPC